MRSYCIFGLIACLLRAWWPDPAAAQDTDPAPVTTEITPPISTQIIWEVKSRFRLFRSEADFQRHVAAHRDDGIFGAEQRLALQSDGRGWARDIVERLCVDRAGRLLGTCDRDGVRESYLAPRDHRVGLVLQGLPEPDLTCVWTFDDGAGEARQLTQACDEEVIIRVAYGKQTLTSVDIVLADGTAHRLVTEIAVRDVLIAGLGDSIAAGEGNPDRAVRLSDIGFCFRRFLGSNSSEYYRPSREGYTGNRSCNDAGEDSRAADWARQSARWESGPCHRSLYSYQLRTTLALAIENTHLAVTFIPLACSGATINAGLLGNQSVRECAIPGTTTSCPPLTRGQIAELTDTLADARRQQPKRSLDLVLLTIGANDINFSGLVGDIIIEGTVERGLARRGGFVTFVPESQHILDGTLSADFAKLRSALKPLVGGNLAQVVYTSYGHPALAGADTPCPGGRDGFDVHPAFNANGSKLHQVANFVSQQFLPKLKALALCDGKACRDPAAERMTFVDAHQAAFAQHGFCARSNDDPAFDRECFSPQGKSFESDLATASQDPMACNMTASDYRPYLPRKRWIRTVNDSYFTAMSYPQGTSVMAPASIHDASWGIVSAVHGGAIHPTAEGHAAMADAALLAVREKLGLPAAAQLPAPQLPAAELPEAQPPAAEPPVAELPAPQPPAAELPEARPPAAELPTLRPPADLTPEP